MGSVCGVYRRLTRSQLYSTICRLKRDINCLSTDLLRFELISKKYRKYLTDLLIIKETYGDNEYHLRLRQDIEAFDTIKKCFVCVENDLNGAEIQSNHLNAEEVVNELENEAKVGIECHINDKSNDGTFVGSVDENKDNSQEIEDLNTNETNGENSHSNESQSGSELNTKSDNNCETNTKRKLKKSDPNCRQSVAKKIKTFHHFVCEVQECVTPFIKAKKLRIHLKIHSDKRHSRDIDDCSAHFSTKNALKGYKESEDHRLGQPFRFAIVCKWIDQ